MANNIENLVPQNKRTKEEQREIAKKGGVASGKARRRKRAMKDIISTFGKEEAPAKVVAKLIQLGMLEKGESCTMDEALILAQYGKALSGNTKAAEFVRDTNGQKPKEKVEINDLSKEKSKLDELLKQRKEVKKEVITDESE